MAIQRDYYSFHVLRIVLLFLIVFTDYGKYVPYFSLATPFFGFAEGTLFAIYGYLVLRSDNDLKQNIIHTLKVFMIFFAVDLVLSIGYMWLRYGTPFGYLTGRTIFNFVVLDYWWSEFGSHIWYIQSVLYSLIIIYVLKKLGIFEKLCVPLCIVLFVIAFFTGEGAGLIQFKVLDYSFLPGNFFTRTLPYMLLGRIIHKHKRIITSIPDWGTALLLLVGVLLNIGELLLLVRLKKAVYYGHLMGFVMITVALLVWGINHHKVGVGAVNAPALFKIMFYSFNPVAEIYIVLLLHVVQDVTTYRLGLIAQPAVVLFLCFFLPMCLIYMKKGHGA